MAMMLRYSFKLEAEAKAVEAAVAGVLKGGHRTKDLAKSGDSALSTSAMGVKIAEKILSNSWQLPDRE
jgi:3-isopropylmalate dehydrogenase